MVGMGMGQQAAASPWGSRPPEPPAAAPPPSPSPSPTWHVAVDGQAKGPFTLDQLRAQAGSGAFTRASLVWQQGMTGWQPAGEVSGLAGLFGAVPPPIPGGV
jgi:hypothetical protein